MAELARHLVAAHLIRNGRAESRAHQTVFVVTGNIVREDINITGGKDLQGIARTTGDSTR